MIFGGKIFLAKKKIDNMTSSKSTFDSSIESSNVHIHQIDFRKMSRAQLKSVLKLSWVKMLKTVEELKEILENEFRNWAHSKTSKTYAMVKQVVLKFTALVVAKNPYDLVILLWKVRPTVQEIYQCFWWTRRGDEIKKRRLYACRLLQKIYEQALLQLKVKEFLDKINRSEELKGEIVKVLEEEVKTTGDMCDMWEAEEEHDRDVKKEDKKRKRDDDDDDFEPARKKRKGEE